MKDFQAVGMIENQTNVKKRNIVGGKGGDNGERIETRRATVEHKTFLNGDGGTRKGRKDKTRESKSKEEEKRLGTGTEGRDTCTSTRKEGERGKASKQRKETERISDARRARITNPPLHWRRQICRARHEGQEQEAMMIVWLTIGPDS